TIMCATAQPSPSLYQSSQRATLNAGARRVMYAVITPTSVDANAGNRARNCCGVMALRPGLPLVAARAAQRRGVRFGGRVVGRLIRHAELQPAAGRLEPATRHRMRLHARELLVGDVG